MYLHMYMHTNLHSYISVMVHNGDHEGVGVAQKTITTKEPASIFPDNDGAVLVR